MNRIRKIIILIAILLSCNFTYAQDGQTFSGVTEYLESIAFNPTDTIISRVCALIDGIDDPHIQSQVAGIVYNWYCDAEIMGQEAVAVYIADNYFLNKKLKWSDEETYPMLYAFAEFNRQSLVGKRAPELELEDINGNIVNIRESDSEYKILYFYDVHCSSCAKQTPALVKLMNGYNGAPVTLYAVYTQSDKTEWTQYVEEYFDDINNEKIVVKNLWDPYVESDFQRKYSVLSTPSMILLDRNDYIIGRRLDTNALAELIEAKNSSKESYAELFDSLFSEISPVDSTVAALVGNILVSKVEKDSAEYRETFFEMFKYLKDTWPDAAETVARSFILEKPEYWAPEFLTRISDALEMFNLNKVGTKANNLVLKNRFGLKRSLHKIKSDYTLLFFHLITCGDCQAELKKLQQYSNTLSDYGIKIVDIYVGTDKDLWKKAICKREKKWLYLQDTEGRSDMHSKYDIAVVPVIYLLDADKTVIARNITADMLLKLME